MKLQVPDDFTGDVHLHGRSFVVDKKGQVEIPDNLLGSSLWQQGFTVATPYPDTAVEAAIEARQPKEKAAHLIDEASKPVKQAAGDNAGKDKM